MRHGVPADEARRLARLGAEDYANGQVLVDALDNGTIRRLYGSGTSAQDRLNGVGDIIRRMTQQDAGLQWDRATPVGGEFEVTSGLRGQYHDVPLASTGEMVRVFRSSDGQVYFCHGLSSGGVDVPNGRFSPLSEGTGSPMGGGMALLLDRSYQQIGRADARPGDLVAWRETHPQLQNDINHSAPLTHVDRINTGQGVDFHAVNTRLQTKNGPFVSEANMTLGDLMREYGHTIEVWRSRASQ